jgi:hypothetical protein
VTTIEQHFDVFVALHAVMNFTTTPFFHSMPLVGIQRRAWTATTLPPTFSAADANSLEIVSRADFLGLDQSLRHTSSGRRYRS